MAQELVQEIEAPKVRTQNALTCNGRRKKVSQGRAQVRLQNSLLNATLVVSRSETRQSNALDLPDAAAIGVCGVICEECMYSW